MFVSFLANLQLYINKDQTKLNNNINKDTPLFRLKHVVYDVMSDVLTYVDFNTSDTILPVFGLKASECSFLFLFLYNDDLIYSKYILTRDHMTLQSKCDDYSYGQNLIITKRA